MEEEERYQLTEKGLAVALAAEKLIRDEGFDLQTAAKELGLPGQEELRLLLVMTPNITLSDIESRK